ncbi:hypothetical protein [Rhodobacter maris]|uniref:Excalibur calcium-binding domain-containing protein n=1 Tax=Rhodobacter maris TaxID=446682 RepID=A0A285TCF7_9RHOB|nr:hypothetical protein [Rhodobacter maris]SOC18937.1 hypothetical protein SAMN05877831_11737 [Rhodobacter maris]
MRKTLVFVLPVLALAACDPPVPNSAAGVGFGDYQSYLQQREAALRGSAAMSPASATATPGAASSYGSTGYGATPVQSAAGQVAAGDGSIGAETLAALRATAPAGETNPVQVAPNATGVGAPLDAMAPAAPPSPAAATGSAGPNLAAYALAATNAPGQQVYKRGGIKLSNSARACGKFISPDLAQMEFLRRGGPERDPANLDPDGDGFACGWDPRPFQAARQ